LHLHVFLQVPHCTIVACIHCFTVVQELKNAYASQNAANSTFLQMLTSSTSCLIWNCKIGVLGAPVSNYKMLYLAPGQILML
jgi:hypothetical protein